MGILFIPEWGILWIQRRHESQEVGEVGEEDCGVLRLKKQRSIVAVVCSRRAETKTIEAMSITRAGPLIATERQLRDRARVTRE